MPRVPHVMPAAEMRAAVRLRDRQQLTRRPGRRTRRARRSIATASATPTTSRPIDTARHSGSARRPDPLLRPGSWRVPLFGGVPCVRQSFSSSASAAVRSLPQSSWRPVSRRPAALPPAGRHDDCRRRRERRRTLSADGRYRPRSDRQRAVREIARDVLTDGRRRRSAACSNLCAAAAAGAAGIERARSARAPGMGRIFGQRFDGESPGGVGCAALERPRARVGTRRPLCRSRDLPPALWRRRRRRRRRQCRSVVRAQARTQALERLLERGGVLIAFVGILFQRAQDDLVDLRIEAGHERSQAAPAGPAGPGVRSGGCWCRQRLRLYESSS